MHRSNPSNGLEMARLPRFAANCETRGRSDSRYLQDLQGSHMGVPIWVSASWGKITQCNIVHTDALSRRDGWTQVCSICSSPYEIQGCISSERTQRGKTSHASENK
jgi:hypothetical protein